jgi:hypothetical protein
MKQKKKYLVYLKIQAGERKGRNNDGLHTHKHNTVYEDSIQNDRYGQEFSISNANSLHRSIVKIK